MNRLLLGGLVGLFAAWPAAADTVTLKDGTVREGTVIREDPQAVTLEVRIGGLKGAVVIPRDEIRSIEKRPLPPDPIETQAAKLRQMAEGQSGQAAAEAWAQLGDFLTRQTGFSAQAKDAYEKAVAADPDNAQARRGLGHTRTAQGWQKVEDERRARGLVPLGEVWVKPDERAWLIDRKHERETEELRIGPRQETTPSRKEVEKELALRRAEQEGAQRDRLRLAYGQSLLSRYGYYAPVDGVYIGSGVTPTWAEGVGVSSGDYEFFVGTIGSGWGPWGYPYECDRRGWGGGWGASYNSGGRHGSDDFRRQHGFSPGFKWGNFSFGTNWSGGAPYWGSSGWGGGSYGSGWGASLSGGSKNFKWSINSGGWSGSSRSSWGWGW